jgi:hypothetical protein
LTSSSVYEMQCRCVTMYLQEKCKIKMQEVRRRVLVLYFTFKVQCGYVSMYLHRETRTNTIGNRSAAPSVSLVFHVKVSVPLRDREPVKRGAEPVVSVTSHI